MPWTTVSIGSAARVHAPDETIRRCLSLIGAEEAQILSRSLGECREMDRYEAYLRGEADDPGVPSRLVGTRMEPDEISARYQEGTCLVAKFGSVPISRELRSVIWEDPLLENFDEIYEDSVLDDLEDNLYFRIGGHDMVRYGDGPPVLVGRYFVSLTIGVEGLPRDPEEFLLRVRKIPEFLDLRARFASHFGVDDLSISIDFDS